MNSSWSVRQQRAYLHQQVNVISLRLNWKTQELSIKGDQVWKKWDVHCEDSPGDDSVITNWRQNKCKG